MSRMGWTGHAPAPDSTQSAWGACQEKDRRHASHVQRSRSGYYRNRYGQEHTAHDWPRFARRHRVAREDLTRTHYIEACEPATCLIGIEAGMATHYVARELTALGHDVKQVPPAYAKPFRQGHKNDFRDAHAVAEAVQRPTTRLFQPRPTNNWICKRCTGSGLAWSASGPQ